MQTDEYLRLHRVARRQRGLFTLQQAQNAGWTRDTIRAWVRAGTWSELAPRVYRYSTSQTTWEDELLACALSADALAARQSAAALFGLLPPPKTPELLVVRGRRNINRLMIHSTTDLPPSDVTRVGPIPTTAPIRTIIDAAGHLPPDRVADLVDRALLRGLVHPVSLDRRARDLEAPARPGAARVMRSLATVHPDLQMARNEWEARVLRLCARFDLPLPTPNLEIHVGGRRRYLDVAWQPSMVLLEFDGYMPHMESRRVFAEDRLRQNDLVSAGWLVFRVTSTMLTPRHFRPIAEAVSHRHQLHRTAV